MKRWLVICCIVVLSSCGRRASALQEAARLMDAHPDSALSVLEGMKRETLSDAQKTEYDILSAEAFYRTYFFLDDGHAAALNAAVLRRERESARRGNLLLLLAAILATLVLYFWARKIQAERLLLEKQTENERMMTIAEDLQSKLSALRSADRKAGVPGIDMLDRLCEQYYVFEGTSSLQPRILGEVRSVIEGLRSDPKMQRSLEQSLNASRGDIIKRLRAAFPKWKDEDFLLYLFSASGFSSTTISTLLEKDKPYVYNRVYRIKERIKASDVPDRAEFLACLEK